MTNNMIALMISGAASLLVLLLGTIIAVIGNLFKKSVFEKLTEISDTLKHLDRRMTGFEKEVLKDYVIKDDYQKNFELNHNSHEKIWIEINEVKSRITKLESN